MERIWRQIRFLISFISCLHFLCIVMSLVSFYKSISENKHKIMILIIVSSSNSPCLSSKTVIVNDAYRARGMLHTPYLVQPCVKPCVDR